MELPDLGRHCANPVCKQLDYLPFKCQYCKQEYCDEHSNPKDHNCPNAPSDDGERVPVCPVCNVPVPVSRGEDPNIRVRLCIYLSLYKVINNLVIFNKIIFYM